jgi:hypothetical protein
MAIIGIGIDIWTPSINGGSRINLPPGQAILFSRGVATVSFLANSPGTFAMVGVAAAAFVGSTGGGGGGTTGQPIGLLLALTYS